MGLQQLANAIMPAVVAAMRTNRWGAFVWSREAWGTRKVPLTWALGTRELVHHDALPRVVWRPKGEASKPARKVATTPRRLLTLGADVELHVWACNIQDVEAIRDELFRALHRVAVGSYEYQGGDWDEERGQIAAGEVLVMRFTLDLAVEDTPSSTATIRHVQTYGAAPGDGRIHVGET